MSNTTNPVWEPPKPLPTQTTAPTTPGATPAAPAAPSTPINLTPYVPPTDTSGSTGMASTPALGDPTNMSGLPGAWQVSPDQVAAFSTAVQQVRSDLDTVFQQVNELTSPTYQPQLGSSPVGQALTAKFVDRLSGESGLLSSLNAVLSHLDQFVSNAERCAADYQESDASSATSLQQSSTT